MSNTWNVRLFLSWCHADRRPKQALLEPLMQNLSILTDLRITWWHDSDLRIGDDWGETLEHRLAGCDYGLLLLSPGYFASDFIVTRELPLFVGAGATPMLPVALKRLPLDGTFDLRGVERRQIFRELGTERPFVQARDRDQFAQDLAIEIGKRILADREQATQW